MIPHSTLDIIEGPSSRTTLVGPDGSVISAIQPGGKVISDNHATLLEQHAPIATYSIPTAPILAHEHLPIPIVEAKAALITPIAKTIVAESIVPHPVLTKSLELVEKHVAIQAAPLVTAVGTKTSISEQSSSIVHPVPPVAIHAEPVAAAHIVEPVVHVPITPVVAAHAAPLAVAHSTPIIGTKTTISEHGQTVVNHPAPVIHEVRTAPLIAPLPAGHGVHSVFPVVAAHLAPVAHVSPVLGAKTVVSEHAETIVNHGAPLLKTHVGHLPVAHHFW